MSIGWVSGRVVLVKNGLKAHHIERLADDGRHSCVKALLDRAVGLVRCHADDLELWIGICF